MSYHSITRQAIELDGARLTLYSKPGLVAWDEVAAATALLAAEAPLRAGLRVLVWDSPALALFAAQRGVETHLYADNLIALEMARAMQRTHSAPTLVIHDERALPPPSADFDLALLLNPKGRAYARLVACAAYHALKNGGRLLFCGANASGAKVFAADAGEVFGKAAVTVRNKARQRLSSLIKAAHAPPPDADW
ncbi:MAG: hypothetical protein HXY40_12610 [Chloroflexi bacterium]|nr:hypothetical protein [Chloroflexota bacterium]